MHHTTTADAMGNTTPACLSAPPSIPTKIHVFVVDDHPLIRHAVAMLLKACSDLAYSGAAGDAAAALSQIAKLKPNVVLVDISLPGYNGIELIKSIRALAPATKVIVMTVHDEETYGLRAFRAGAKGYICKDAIARDIIQAIRRIHAGNAFMSPRTAEVLLNEMQRGRRGCQDPVDTLSDRELEIVELIGTGTGTAEIATKLRIGLKTVEAHRAHIKEKLSLNTAIKLVQFCVRWVEQRRQNAPPSRHRKALPAHA